MDNLTTKELIKLLEILEGYRSIYPDSVPQELTDKIELMIDTSELDNATCNSFFRGYQYD